jgi:hypothetical protein
MSSSLVRHVQRGRQITRVGASPGRKVGSAHTTVGQAGCDECAAVQLQRCSRRWWVDHGGVDLLLLGPEMDEDPSEIVGVLFDPVVQRLDLLLVEEAQYALFQLAASFPGDDLDRPGLFGHGLVDDGPQGAIDVIPSVVDLVKVQLELHGRVLHLT